jgi:hypothetical protein
MPGTPLGGPPRRSGVVRPPIEHLVTLDFFWWVANHPLDFEKKIYILFISFVTKKVLLIKK